MMMVGSNEFEEKGFIDSKATLQTGLLFNK